jgi:[ribosomal protein S18]-alanine N-acetyltransferase
LRALDESASPLALSPLSGEMAFAMADIHSRSFEKPWSAADLRRLAEAPHCYGISARCEGRLVGFIMVGAAADEAEILTLAVDEDFRGQGVGRALVDAAITEAMDRGVTAMLLEVGVLNAAGQALYSSAGFVVVGRRRNYYRGSNGYEDALVMRADIAPYSQ